MLFMKKILFYLLVFTLPIKAHWLENIPQTITQSNGQVIHCFATGDQYVHRLHDKNNYTIILNPDDGDFYYAEKIGDKLRPSIHKVGIADPIDEGIVPGLMAGISVYTEKKEHYEIGRASCRERV